MDLSNHRGGLFGTKPVVDRTQGLRSMQKEDVKILIVSNKQDLRGIIRDYLRVEGFVKFIFSEDGRSAYKKVVTEFPTIVIADNDLQGMSGLELLKHVRKNPATQDLLFVIMSSVSDQEHVATAGEFKVSALLIKPFSHKTLAEKINHLYEKKYNPSAVDLGYQEGNQLLESGDLDGALEKYREVLAATEKGMAALHYKVGQVHEKMEQIDDAETNYHQAVDMSGFFVEAWDALGTISLSKDQVQEAHEYFRRGVDISPGNAARQLKLGEISLELGDFETAERAFKHSISLDPSQTHLFNQLGISLRRQGKLKEAIAYLIRAIKVAETDENLYFNLARVYMDQGDKEKAMDNLEKALEINPDFKEAKDVIQEMRSRLN